MKKTPTEKKKKNKRTRAKVNQVTWLVHKHDLMIQKNIGKLGVMVFYKNDVSHT